MLHFFYALFCGLIISHPLKVRTITTYQQVLALPGGNVISHYLNFKAHCNAMDLLRNTIVTFKHHLHPHTEAIPSQFQVITGLNLCYTMWVSVEIQGNLQQKI